jgi:hypothetical protein
MKYQFFALQKCHCKKQKGNTRTRTMDKKHHDMLRCFGASALNQFEFSGKPGSWGQCYRQVTTWVKRYSTIGKSSSCLSTHNEHHTHPSFISCKKTNPPPCWKWTMPNGFRRHLVPHRPCSCLVGKIIHQFAWGETTKRSAPSSQIRAFFVVSCLHATLPYLLKSISVRNPANAMLFGLSVLQKQISFSLSHSNTSL